MRPKISDLAEGYVPPHKVFKWAGREVTVYKMSPRSLEKAVRVAEPHIKDVIMAMVDSTTLEQARTGKRVDKKKAEGEIWDLIKGKLSEMAIAAPSIVFQILACIMDIPEEGPEHDFYWNEISLDELLDSVEQLDVLNDFSLIANRLVKIVQYLARRYGIEIADVSIVENPNEEG